MRPPNGCTATQTPREVFRKRSGVERGRPLQQTPELLRDAITWRLRDGDSLTVDLPAYLDRIVTKDRVLERWRARQ